MPISIIGVPSSAGAYGVGSERAPEALRLAGLVAALTAEGLDITDLGDSEIVRFRPDPHHRRAQNLERVADVVHDVAARVEHVVRDGTLPLVIGGDCTITLGVLDGMLRAGRDPALAYLDGDLDLSTPATTTSGILDAMGVAHMLDIDGVDDELAGIGSRRPLLDGRSLALIGHEEAGRDAAALLDERGAHRVAASCARSDPGAAARRALDALDGDKPLVIHFDVDVVDSVDCPLAQFPHFNTGISLADATTCLTELCAAPNLAALVVTEVNPHHDPDGTQTSRLVETLTAALAASAPPAPRRDGRPSQVGPPPRSGNRRT